MLISRPEELPPALAASLSAGERALIAELPGRGLLPFGLSPHIASLAGPGRGDPVRGQFIPDPRELLPDPFALEDPLGEALYRRAPRLIHQYQDRALLLAGGGCGAYCRHCFRRVRQGGAQSFITGEELAPALAYLRGHPEIGELLISGGDPLTAGDGALDRLFADIREARPGLALRLCTRIPLTDPPRLGEGLRDLLRSYAFPQGKGPPLLRAAIQVNHPRELSPPALGALSPWVEAGIPVLVQTVLLRGINDRAETLGELFRGCRALGLKPYYLFQLDLAPGIAHFRVPLREGLALYRELSAALPPPALPAYAADLPGGGGKIALREEALAGEGEDHRGRFLLLRARDGKLWPYPAD
jgi:lysine 2,3-aminomutase